MEVEAAVEEAESLYICILSIHVGLRYGPLLAIIQSSWLSGLMDTRDHGTSTSHI